MPRQSVEQSAQLGQSPQVTMVLQQRPGNGGSGITVSLLNKQRRELLSSIPLLGVGAHDLLEVIDRLLHQTVLGEDAGLRQALRRIESLGRADRIALRLRRGLDLQVGDLDLLLDLHHNLVR